LYNVIFVIPSGLPTAATIAKLIPQWLNQGQDLALQGQLPTYIPQLAGVNPDLIALAVGFKDQSMIGGWQDANSSANSNSNSITSSITNLGTTVNLSQSDLAMPQFPLMSLIKPFLLLYLLQIYGMERVLDLVNTNASDLPFNVIPTTKPPNPMLNCGAIALCSLLVDTDNFQDSHHKIHRGSQKFQSWLQQIMDQSITPSKPLFINPEMVNSVRSVPQRRNLAITSALESLDIIKQGASALQIYEEICCLTTDVIGLAKLGQALLNSDPISKLVLSVMTDCGMYAHSAKFAEDVGIPAKSAVSGAILGIMPEKAAIASYSPPLDQIGNSVGGLFLLAQVKAFIPRE
jgi:glutaminase